MATEQITTAASAAAFIGVTAPTIGAWVRKGHLPPGPPWTPAQLRKAAVRRPYPERGTSAEHGTPDRWRTGCRCDDCADAHLADLRTRRRRHAIQAWADLEQPLIDAIARGATYADALAQIDVTAQAVTAHRHRSPAFADALDDALRVGRNPRAEHPHPTTWRLGCRCPECREQHEATRRAPARKPTKRRVRTAG